MQKSSESIVSYDPVSAKARYGEAVRMFLMDCQFRNLSKFTIEGYHTYLQLFQRDLEAWQLSLETLTPKDLSVRMINEMLDRQFNIQITHRS